MSDKTTMDLMDELHLLTAEKFKDILKNGVAVLKDGEVVYVDPTPAYIAAAVKFLKDNDVTVDPGSGRFDPLGEALNDIPEFEDDGDGQYAYRN